MRVSAVTCHLYCYGGTTGVERIPRQDQASTETKLWRRTFCRLSCWGSNPRPCDHQSGPLPQNCIPWAIYAHVINKCIQMPKAGMHHTGPPFLLSTFQSAKHAMFGLAGYYDHSIDHWWQADNAWPRTVWMTSSNAFMASGKTSVESQVWLIVESDVSQTDQSCMAFLGNQIQKDQADEGVNESGRGFFTTYTFHGAYTERREEMLT